MYHLIHSVSGRTLLTFGSLEEALLALQEAAVPELFYISNAK
jgi:hypothetical protein